MTTQIIEYVVIKPSAEANICLNCKIKKCKGNCERYKQEIKKVKKNDRV